MMGPTHRIWGAHQGMVTGAAVGHLWGGYTSLSVAVLWSGLGYAFACVPDAVEAPLGLGHRKQSHWPEPPLLVALVALAVAAGGFGYLVMMLSFAVAGVCSSLLSHWTGDFMFGKAWIVHGHVVRPRGVPMLFGTKYRGLGWKVDEDGEKLLRKFLRFSFPALPVLVFYFTLRG